MAKESAYTCTRQIPAAYTCEDLAPVYGAGHNLDWGGGRYDDATDFLMHHYVCKNSVYDPYNRTEEHNKKVLQEIPNDLTPLVSLSILNVLNVITDDHERWLLLNKVMSFVNQFKTCQAIVIQVYEGNRSGVPSKAPHTQLNKPASFYKGQIADAAPHGWYLSPKMYGDKKNIYLLTRKEDLIMAAPKATTTTVTAKKTSAKKATSTKKKPAGEHKDTLAEVQVKRELAAQLDRMFSLANPHGMSVTSCQMLLLKEPLGKTRALARVVMNECMQLTGLKVMEGVNGLFVSYPNDPNYKGEDYRSLFYPVTRELREHIEQQVLLKYQETLDLNRQVS